MLEGRTAAVFVCQQQNKREPITCGAPPFGSVGCFQTNLGFVADVTQSSDKLWLVRGRFVFVAWQAVLLLPFCLFCLHRDFGVGSIRSKGALCGLFCNCHRYNTRCPGIDAFSWLLFHGYGRMPSTKRELGISK